MSLKNKNVSVLVLTILVTAGCNSNYNSNTDIINPELAGEQAASFSSPVGIEGDERDNGSSAIYRNSVRTVTKSRPLPTQPLFAAFNNDYKGLYTDNETIARNDPNNPDKYIFSLINSAKQTLDVAIYDIDDPGVTSALIEAQKRGVNVRFLTDGSNLQDKTDPTKPRQAIVDLKAAGIPVKDDGKRSAFMHDKIMIIDNTYVYTGSENFSTFALYRDNNNVLVINSPELAANYNAEFKRMFEDGIFNGNQPHQIPNPVVTVADATIKTYFSPSGGTKAAILAEMNKATKSIKVMAFAFTDQDTANIMIQKKKIPGFQVEGIFDECEISKYSAYNPLRKANIFVRGDGNQALMHHKTMLIDDTTVITGSYNFSKNAEVGNNENTLIIKSPSLAKVYSAEYERVKYAALHNTNLPPYDHPACNH